MLSEIFRFAARLPGYVSGKKMAAEALDLSVAALLEEEQGLAFGEIHGSYAFPDFMARNMKMFSEQGVKTLYLEHFFTQQQELIDQWQDGGDAQPLLDHINRQGVYATQMWHRYWEMMKAAQQNGIRMVAIDYDGPDLMLKLDDVELRNDKWMETIAADRAQVGAEDKFIIYGGQAHFRNGLLKKSGIGTQLDIPTIIMENGDGRFGKVPGMEKRYQIHLPYAEDQDMIYGPLHKSRAPEIKL